VHHALRLLYQGLAPMVPGQESALVDLIPVDFAAAASHHLFEHAFSAGATYHLCAGQANSVPLGALLDATTAAFERHRPAWRKRSIARPALVDLDTYELFVRTVEEARNEVLLQATRAVQAFAYQLAYPKIFDARHASAVLAPAGIEPPHVLYYYDAVVRWFFGHEWRAPQVIIVLLAFGLGAAFGVLAMVPAWWRHRRAAQRLDPLPAASTPAPEAPVVPFAAHQDGV
jgi:hypothetical protein